MNLESIQREAVRLNSSDRARLIDLLWESLDDSRRDAVDAKWGAESEDRIDAFERGELPAIDGYAALEKIRSLIN